MLCHRKILTYRKVSTSYETHIYVRINICRSAKTFVRMYIWANRVFTCEKKNLTIAQQRPISMWHLLFSRTIYVQISKLTCMHTYICTMCSRQTVGEMSVTLGKIFNDSARISRPEYVSDKHPHMCFHWYMDTSVYINFTLKIFFALFGKIIISGILIN